MGYDWDDKRDICFKLYVTEKRPLDEVVDYFRDKLEFVPSKRTFQTQFRRWGFPAKHDYSHKDEAVVARVREMWERNVMQKDMLPILQAEGYNVTESGLMRLRFKHGMHLKTANLLGNAVAEGTNDVSGAVEGIDAIATATTGAEPDLSLLTEASTGSKRKGRDDLQASNEEKWKAKKRRRHTREWNGLPPDPPGPPRYPSETTLGEAQRSLGLDTDMYRQLREQFQAICQERSIVKKTECGPEAWEAAKQHVVQSMPHLQQLFDNTDPPSPQPLQLFLDVICMDVTKHMRNQSKNMSLAEAKNTLGLNPLESRLMKQKLFKILLANNFVNTYETENWNELKEEWLHGTVLQERMPMEEGLAKERYLKAVQLLCRDTLKRWRETVRASEQKKNVQHDNPTTSTIESPSAPKTKTKAPARRNKKSLPAASKAASSDVQIDPSLLQAANTSSLVSAENHQPQAYPAPGAAEASLDPPLAVYFRRGSMSTDVGVPPLWLGILATRDLSGLYQAALSFQGGSEYAVVKIEGVTPSPQGGELLYQIDRDDELHGYLLHSAGGKATFVVHLAGRM
ncbi:hypothetical protein KVT40_007754 [Elsinoe batatas]|uniref:Clr5 domain-containing protein n=1 Tax=Elsinoe batatas TaxID=2601811 RepID=A0A8K0KW85_9PEZI|nr:hypothetical protein KVT40_007754 [Elsinoe batatas]